MDVAERAVLAGMLASAAGELDQPSPFWTKLGRHHIRQLERSGFESFKRTVNVRYFNWRIPGILRHQLLGVARQWLRHPDPAILGTRLAPAAYPSRPGITSFDPVSAVVYALYVAMLADVVARGDPRGLLARLQEPVLGDPILVRYRGRAFSQDLCNSVHEFYSTLGDVEPSDAVDVAEVGAGYGRLAWVVLTELPRATYTIVDLPPALYLSQRYLTTLRPDVPAFRFRGFDSYAEIQDEFGSARLRFLLPHQAELLPERSFDRMITISTLHEMTVQQIDRYFALFDRVSRGLVYTKQWRRSRARVNGRVLRESDYPVPGHWQTVFHRRHPIQTMFFESMYRVR